MLNGKESNKIDSPDIFLYSALFPLNNSTLSVTTTMSNIALSGNKTIGTGSPFKLASQRTESTIVSYNTTPNNIKTTKIIDTTMINIALLCNKSTETNSSIVSYNTTPNTIKTSEIINTTSPPRLATQRPNWTISFNRTPVGLASIRSNFTRFLSSTHKPQIIRSTLQSFTMPTSYKPYRRTLFPAKLVKNNSSYTLRYYGINSTLSSNTTTPLTSSTIVTTLLETSTPTVNDSFPQEKLPPFSTLVLPLNNDSSRDNQYGEILSGPTITIDDIVGKNICKRRGRIYICRRIYLERLE